MNESVVSLAKLTVVTLWSAVAAFIAAAWVSLALGSHEVSAALGFTGCATSAAAATAHMRRYATRICNLMRYLNIPGEGHPSPVRALRD
jgi:hypothetical protein